MKTTMKTIIFIFCVVCSTTMYGQQFGYIHSDSVFASIPQFGRNASKLDSLKQTYKKELDQSRADLQQRFDKLIKPYVVAGKETTLPELKTRMSQADTISLGLLLDEDKAIQKKGVSYDNMIKLVYSRDIQSVVDRVAKVIADYAVSHKLSAVYIIEKLMPQVAYIDPKQDVTKAVIAKLKEK